MPTQVDDSARAGFPAKCSKETYTSIGFTLLIRTMARCDLFGFQLSAFVAAKAVPRNRSTKSFLEGIWLK